MQKDKFSGLEDYVRLRDLSYDLSMKIIGREIAYPSEIKQISLKEGDEVSRIYYFMDALMHHIEYDKWGRIADYTMKDEKPIQRHFFDSAFRSYFRYTDPELPSNYLSTLREQKGILVHDLAENFGKNIIGALVVNHVIKNLFGNEIGNDASLLTDMNAFVLKSINRKVRSLKEINPDNVYKILYKKRDDIIVGQGTIDKQYVKVLNALKKFEKYAVEKADYMPESEKNSLLNIINNLYEDINENISSKTLLSPDVVSKNMKMYYNNVMNLIKKGEYLEVDERLILPDESEFLIMLKRTLYRDYIKKIHNQVLKDAISYSKNGDSPDDSYLRLAMEKIPELTDTVINMPYQPNSKSLNIQRKGRIDIIENIELINNLKNLGKDYSRLFNGVDYLYENLIKSVNRLIGAFTDEDDSSNNLNLNRLLVVKEKVMGLEEQVKELAGIKTKNKHQNLLHTKKIKSQKNFSYT